VALVLIALGCFILLFPIRYLIETLNSRLVCFTYIGKPYRPTM
jgi:hypothetical protein